MDKSAPTERLGAPRRGTGAPRCGAKAASPIIQRLLGGGSEGAQSGAAGAPTSPEVQCLKQHA
eukprot:9142720-Alexandrium_andersonii.AAC.1